MTRAYIASIALGAVLACSLVLGQPAHALVAHEHGDHHLEGESIVWQSLHASLRHESENALPFFDVLAIVGAVCILSYAVILRRRIRIVDSIEDALRRGTLPHRMFG